MTNRELAQSEIDALLSLIPIGTDCTETNPCGGSLTPQQAEQLERLLRDIQQQEGEREALSRVML